LKHLLKHLLLTVLICYPSFQDILIHLLIEKS
jgi:hypothetical protein